jgi:FlaA1/EpsC-like NDP-sugar epimerase
MQIHGVPVLGGQADIPRLIREHGVDRVIIAMPTAPGVVIREIVTVCEKAGVKTKIIPEIYDLLDGSIHVNQIRDVDIEDLLRREPVQTDTAAVRELLRGQRVLVTGGGGSIGGELCRQILRSEPAELVLLGHGENSIFEIYHELQRLNSGRTKITPLIADTRFPERVQLIVKQVKPTIIFHAAAHKHVPMMEMNPAEAITNNVLGTQNLLEAALANNVAHFVMISTDKAVNPSSVMGASKRVAELLVHRAARESRRPYVAVRFGNVLGSRGSVILTFKKQIAAGGPITITHPDIKRFFMTIPEAVQLVLQAAVLGQGGEVYVLDMGEPVKIMDLAHDLIELSGLQVGRDIAIEVTGLRPGEKLFEELFVPGENYERTRHEKIFIAGNASSFVSDGLDAGINALTAAAERNDRQAILRCLKNLVSEFDHDSGQNGQKEAESTKTRQTLLEGNGTARAVQAGRV